MSLATPDEIKDMDWGLNGDPFVALHTSTADTANMDYSMDGDPFVINPAGATGWAHVQLLTPIWG